MDQKPTSESPVRGRQRQAVYAALKHPATGRQILEAARKTAPSMSYQDLRHILRDFQDKGLVICLNPEQQTGRLYSLANFWENLSRNATLIYLSSRISRAKTRLAVLKEVAKERFFESRPLTATTIRKLMRESYPMGLNHVLAALKFLEGHGVIEVCGYTDKRELKIYRITNLGRNVMEGLLQERTDSVTESTPNRMP